MKTESVYNYLSYSSNGDLTIASPSKNTRREKKSPKDLYQSIHAQKTRQEYKKSQQGQHATLGLSHYPLAPPTEFLTKGQSATSRPIVKKESHQARAKERDELWKPRYTASKIPVPTYPKHGKRSTELEKYVER